MGHKLWIQVGFSSARRLSSVNYKIVKSINPEKLTEVDAFTPDRIRNFGIVAHVDHGKSSLADKILQMTNVISVNERKQFLDKLQVERDRGITVKAQSCSMVYKDHLFNLIDTPGHADFSFEVSRSLAACDGIVLLVAANQGVQAQTLANFWLAFEREIVMIPVINKIDLKEAKIEQVLSQLHNLFDFAPEDVLKISAKSGINVESVLDAVLEKIPPPNADPNAPFRALIFDSWFEQFRGAIAMIAVKEGSIARGQKIASFNGQKEYEVAEVGIMYPSLTPTTRLCAGQIGYVICNMKTVQEAAVGETLFDPAEKATVKCFPGFTAIKPTVYSGLFPVETAMYEDLKQAVERLSLNDPSVTVSPDSSPALGLGWKIGFLGMLHMEVFSQRLDQEYDANVILTVPNVEYKAAIKDNETIRKKRYAGKGEITFTDPSHFPDVSDVDHFLEPIVLVTIIVPLEYLNTVSSLCVDCRGERGDISLIDNDRVLIKSKLPLAEVVVDFFERLKKATSGYASFDYEPVGYQEANLVRLGVSINGRQIDEFSIITTAGQAPARAKALVAKLKEEIPRQQYDVNIRATLGNSTKAVAQGMIKAYKKDFSQLLKGNFGGGGMERLNKKLSHQKKGKERMKMIGQVQIPKEAFINILRS
uniref:Translation factor GUF1 homolog, mitochondrial n=1 Tax=Panagrellus redivivus TaxID=6233 RepID=A0A7E4W0Y8_PANRE